jgi:Domain of unknown function (DUF4157)/L,D-transpeptidase catalytic domain
MNLRSPIQTNAKSFFTPIQTGLLQRKCNSCGQHKIAGEECTNCQPKSGLQRKLTIGASNDPLELEADRIADRVLATPANPIISTTPPRIQRFTGQTAGQADVVPASVDQVLSSPGRPLEASLQQDMGQQFGHDFSRVRVHTGDEAARSAQDVNANAYTVGRNIVFGTNQFLPGSNGGRKLLAHELTHVVQQSSVRELHIQRQAETESEYDLTETDTKEEVDASEVHDGDSPVDAMPDLESTLTDISSDKTSKTLVETVGLKSGEIFSAQAGAIQERNQSKSPPPTKKVPPKTVVKIDVDQATQMMTVTWSDGTTEKHAVSTGKGRPNTSDDPCKTQTEHNCTPNGSFKAGSLGNGDTKNSHGDAMAWYVGFVDNRGIGIHDSQPVPGVPASHGCVRVGNSSADDAFAKKINKAVVPGSTTINVSGKAPTKPWRKIVPAPKTPKPKKK